ncbi:MAG: MFS transporter, partial [Planctomycetaceae bacterium]
PADSCPPQVGPTVEPATGGGGSFASLTVVRFLSVLNDNLSRWLVIGLGKRAAAAAGATDASVLALGTVFFVLPFILFAWLAGWLADRFAKRSVVVGWKFAEIVIAVATAIVVGWGSASGPLFAGLPLGFWLLQLAIASFALQTTLLNPSLLGTIAETIPSARLASANGLFALVTLAATLVGMAAGNWLADATWLTPVPEPSRPLPSWLASLPLGRIIPAATALIGVAIAGFLASLALPRIPAADPRAPFPTNALTATIRDIRSILGSPRLAGAAVGIIYFWALGAVVQLNIDQFAAESGSTKQAQVVPLLVALVGGIGAGSVLAGRLSRRGVDKESSVDLGLVPIGGVVMALACGAIACSSTHVFGDDQSALSLAGPVFWLAVLGIGAGLFDVPLEAYLQEQSPPHRRGAILASTNLMVFAGMLVASIGYYALRVPVGAPGLAKPLLSARGVFGLFAILSCVAVVLAVWAAPRASLRIVVSGLVHAVWRFRVRGIERVPAEGPLVIVANHLSWLDGFLLPIACPRPVRMVVYGPNIRGRLLNRLADQWRFILFEPQPKSIARALRTIQDGLAQGDCIGIFCEGGISRTGQIMGYKRGLEWLLSRIESPILPASIDGLWGSVLTYSEGRYLTKVPRRFGRTITLSFGSVLPCGTHPDRARLALQEVATRAVRARLGSPPAGSVEAAWAATAEAFDGCCLVRREDRLLSSLVPGDPLYESLGRQARRLLGIAAEMTDGSESCGSPSGDARSIGVAVRIRDRLLSGGFTIWLASPRVVEEVANVASRDGATGAGVAESPLVAVVMPIGDPDELEAAERAAERFQAACGVLPVVAFAPHEVGGLVSMN